MPGNMAHLHREIPLPMEISSRQFNLSQTLKSSPRRNYPPHRKFPGGEAPGRKLVPILLLKMCAHFPITNTMRKQWANFITESHCPLGFGGGGEGRNHVISKGKVIGPFNYNEQNGYLKILIGWSWENINNTIGGTALS